MIKLRKGLFEGPGVLTQKFGENPQWYAKFGMKGHNGIDYGIVTGTQLYSAIDGKVTERYNDTNGYGKYVKIENDECGIIYAHMRVLTPLQVGTEVKAGDPIGESGNTGNSTGPHLHFGVFPKPRNRANGYLGYIDPLGDRIVWVDGDETECEELEKEIQELEKTLEEVRNSRDRWKEKAEVCEERCADEIAVKNSNIEAQQKQISLLNEQLTTLNKQYESLLSEKKLLEANLEAQKEASDKEIAELEEKVEIYENLHKKCEKSREKLKQENEELKKKLDQGLDGYTKWELFKALFRG